MIRLLFVDDETRVLDGLRRLLYGERERWQTSFASSGAAAMELLKDAEFDVVVSDMRMPGIDGATLLEFVRERYPATIRIVLSGQAETFSASRAMAVAHQFLSKPLQGPELVRILDRALAQRASIERDVMWTVAHKVGALPPAPNIYQSLCRGLSDPGFTVEALEALVRSDGALAANVMHLANSSYFGRSGRLASLRDAVALVGSNAIRHFVLSAEVFSGFSRSVPATVLDLDALQERCLRVARIASAIVEERPHREDAFAAGLLHDAGLIVMAAHLPGEFRRIQARLRSGSASRPEVEREVVGFHHGDLGGYLFSLWGLPEGLTEAARCHPDMMLAPGSPITLPAAVAVADDLSRLESAPGTEAASGRFESDPRWEKWCEQAAEIRSEEAA